MTAFDAWLSQASPGKSLVYFTGFLADYVTPPSPAEKLEGEAALQAYADGKVEIAQKRVKPASLKRPGAFSYIAQKRKEVRAPEANGERWRMRIGPMKGHWA